MNIAHLKHALAMLLIAGLSLASSGCFLLTISGVTSELDGSLITTVETDAMLTTCVQSNFNVSCTYFFLDENGVPLSVTSSAELISEFGILGALIDPLIYQIPANATNVTGTYEDDTGFVGDLIVRSGFKSIPADTYQTTLAEPGQQFALVELPDGTPFDDQQYRMRLSFDQPVGSPTPVQVKSLLSLKFVGNGQEFYMPYLPCTTDMTAVDPLVIPTGTSLQPLAVPTDPLVCQGNQYRLLGFGVSPCDFDGDDDVDRNDIAIQGRAKNAPALSGDRLDANSDGWIDITDVRSCVLQCTLPRCALPPSPADLLKPLKGALSR